MRSCSCPGARRQRRLVFGRALLLVRRRRFTASAVAPSPVRVAAAAVRARRLGGDAMMSRTGGFAAETSRTSVDIKRTYQNTNPDRRTNRGRHSKGGCRLPGLPVRGRRSPYARSSSEYMSPTRKRDRKLLRRPRTSFCVRRRTLPTSAKAGHLFGGWEIIQTTTANYLCATAALYPPRCLFYDRQQPSRKGDISWDSHSWPTARRRLRGRTSFALAPQT